MHVDEAGNGYETVGIEDLGILDVDRGLDGGHRLVLDQDVRQAIELLAGVEDSGASD